MKRTLPFTLFLAFSFFSYAQNNVTKAEYFLDTDNGVGLNTVLNVTPQEDVTDNLTVTIPAGTPLGFHKLYYRTRDTNKSWSQTTRNNITIIPATVVNNVMKGEYFLDSDPTVTFGFPFTVSPQSLDITQIFMAQLPSDLSIGYHKLYGRIKDAYGIWSQTFRINIEVIQSNSVNKVVEAEYFFGNDPDFGNATSVVLATPQTDGSWIFNVPYPTGNYNFADKLFIRTKDENGKWSHTTVLDAIDVSLVISNNNLKKYILFPNPASDYFTISSDENETFDLILSDNLGKIVLNRRIMSNEKVDISNLSGGLYFVGISNEKSENQTFKIIKK